MSPHAQIGPFEVLEKLGAGGMGEVFKARDTRLNRFVALKFLPEAASDAARERFQREAMAIAALNHPHICTLYEVGDDGGRPYLVLELLEGETLYQRLRRGPVPLTLLLQWSTEIADAVYTAHAQGILHRDLKPGNIFVTRRGSVKVLDFGLAQFAATAASAEAATLAGSAAVPGLPPLTTPGAALGTVAYMSPEQARGEPTDARSDIFSLGVVVYEMAGGQPPFQGRTSADLSAAILTFTPPPPSALRAEIPPRLDDIVSQCLEKEPDQRFQSAADLRISLRRLQGAAASSGAPGPPAIASGGAPPSTPTPMPLPAASGFAPRPRRRWRLPAAAAAAVVVAAAAWVWWRFVPHAPATPPKLTFRQLTFTGHLLDAAISPDGKFLAHVDLNPDGTSLHLLSIASGSDVEIVPPGHGCCASPSFPPDGSAVYFQAGYELQAVPVLGGTLRTIATQVCTGAGFSPDGQQIAYLTSPAILTLARPDGSQPRLLHQTAPGDGFVSSCWGNFAGATHEPAWSPDGRHIALALFGASRGGTRLDIVDVAAGRDAPLGPPWLLFGDPNWLPDGRGVVMTATRRAAEAPQVWLTPYPSGAPQPLTSDLQGYASASLSAQGDLALLHNAPQYSIWIQGSPAGDFHALSGGATRDGVEGLAWTPQGGLVATRALGGPTEMWVENADGSSARRLVLPPDLTLYNAPALTPVVTPSGEIAFSAGSVPQIWRVHADSSGLERLATASGMEAVFPALVNGGRAVAYTQIDRADHQTLWVLPLDGGAPRQIWSGQVFADGNPASPDGTRLFAESEGPHKEHIAVVLTLGGAEAQVRTLSLNHATMLQPYGWTPDGRAITYVSRHGSTDNLWAFPLDGGQPRALTHFTDLSIAAYAWSRDGRLALSRGSNHTDAVLAIGIGKR